MDDQEKDGPPPKEGSGQLDSKSGLNQFAKYSELALVLPAGTVGGWLIGAWLDHRFHTHWIYLVGIVLGFIGGFVHIFRVAFKDSK